MKSAWNVACRPRLTLSGNAWGRKCRPQKNIRNYMRVDFILWYWCLTNYYLTMLMCDNSYVNDLKFIELIRCKALWKTRYWRRFRSFDSGAIRGFTHPDPNQDLTSGAQPTFAHPIDLPWIWMRCLNLTSKLADVNRKCRLKNVVAITKRFQPIVG